MIFTLLLAVLALQGQGAQPAQSPPTARLQAPIDLTGYWVSVVTEDWRWRMLTPPKGDYSSLPLNDEGRKVEIGRASCRERVSKRMGQSARRKKQHSRLMR